MNAKRIIKRTAVKGKSRISKSRISSSKKATANKKIKRFDIINQLLIVFVIFDLFMISAIFLLNRDSVTQFMGYVIGTLSGPTPATVTVNFSNEVGVVRDDFYGVNTHGIWGSNLSWIWTGGRGSSSNYTWHREKLQEAGLNYLRADMSLNNVANSDGTFKTANVDNYRNINTRKNLVEWAKSSNTKILFIASYMPEWLQNRASGWCDSSAWATCSPTNYTKWGELVVDFLQAVGCDANTCEVEVWNEPDLKQFWLNNLIDTNITRSKEYNKLYNATYIAVKSAYPTMAVGGPATTGKDADTNLIMLNWMGNFSNKIDFVSHHDYLGQGLFTDYYSALADDYAWIFGDISYYHVNTSRVLIDEYNVWSSDIKLNELDEWATQLSLAYAVTLNFYPSNITLAQYQWSDTNSYNDDSANYGEYPQRWAMVSEAGLDNPTATYYASYNLTKNFATYHSAGSMVVRSNSSSSNVKAVASKKEDNQYITVINSGAEANVTLNISRDMASSVEDLETGQVYNTEDGSFYIGLMNQYQIRYFETNYTPISEPVECTTDNNCTANSLPSIGECNNNPDNNSLTWDYAPANQSVCNLLSNNCTIPAQQEVTSSCNVSCGASCDTAHLCSNTSCTGLSGCNGSDYYDYSDVENNCSNCNCQNNSCTDVLIYENDSRCIICGNRSCDSYLGENCSTCSSDCGICPIPDTNPPVRSSGSPTGNLSFGITSTTLSLDTNEAATCRYSTTANTPYSSMNNTFSSANSTLQISNVSGLQSGKGYTYYARCNDSYGNANTNDFVISFIVSNVTLTIVCGDNTCSSNESCTSCSADCGDCPVAAPSSSQGSGGGGGGGGGSPRGSGSSSNNSAGNITTTENITNYELEYATYDSSPKRENIENEEKGDRLAILNNKVGGMSIGGILFALFIVLLIVTLIIYLVRIIKRERANSKWL